MAAVCPATLGCDGLQDLRGCPPSLLSGLKQVSGVKFSESLLQEYPAPLSVCFVTLQGLLSSQQLPGSLGL